MKCFYSLSLICTAFDTKYSHVFTESYTEQHFVTLVSFICVFLAVT